MQNNKKAIKLKVEKILSVQEAKKLKCEPVIYQEKCFTQEEFEREYKKYAYLNSLEDFLKKIRFELEQEILSIPGTSKLPKLFGIAEGFNDADNPTARKLISLYFKANTIEREFKAGNFEQAILEAFSLGSRKMMLNLEKHFPAAGAGYPFVAQRESSIDEAKSLWENRKILYDSLKGNRPMERYRKIVKIENPKLRSGDKKFEAAVSAMKTYFSEHKTSLKKGKEL